MNVVVIERLPSVQQAICCVLEAIPGLEKLTVLTHETATEFEESGQGTLVVFGCSSDSVADRSSLTETIRRYAPLRSLALYECPQADFAQYAVRLGVAGYVSKAAAPIVMSESIKLLLAGGRCYPPIICARPIAASNVGSIHEPRHLPETSAPRPRLTGRQLQLLGMLAAGEDAREIGEKMGISVATVRSHANKLYHKLHARNQAEAVFNATRHGLV